MTDSISFSKRGDALIGQEMFKILDRARRLEDEGFDIYHLELGNPRLRPPKEIISTTIEALHNLNVGYTSSAGLPKLRQALAHRYTKLSGRDIKESNIVVSPANLLLSQVLDLTCNGGDKVVLFTPAFPSYFAAAAHIGLQVIPIPLDSSNGFTLKEREVEAAIAVKPKVIMVNSANNPTGAVYDKKVLDLLARRCNEEGIWLVSDETYAELCYGAPFYSLATLAYPKVIVISSLSKIFSIPGFRIGYAIAHTQVVEKLVLSNSTLISCLPAFVQEGCVAGLQVIDQYVSGIRKHFDRVAGECSKIINDSGILKCSRPQAGFYIFLDISALGLDDVSFSNKLLEERHTAVTSGRSFGEEFKNSIRIAVCGKYDDVIQGINLLILFAGDLKSNCGLIERAEETHVRKT